MRSLILIVTAVLLPMNVKALEGYDHENDAYVHIFHEDNTIEEGDNVHVYEHSSGIYKPGEVMSVSTLGPSTELEIFDPQDWTNRTIELSEN